MDEKNLSTNYVPLMPPYQIIKYGQEIGLQIGTLIATRAVDGDKNHPFRIETHSYPVVAYENKETAPLGQNLFSSCFMEGVVWNRVELRDVSTVCLSTSHLSWHEFLMFLCRDMDRTGWDAAPDVDSIVKLHALGVSIDPIPEGVHTINLQFSEIFSMKVIEGSPGDHLIFRAVFKEEKLEETAMEIQRQLALYRMNLYMVSDREAWKPLKVRFDSVFDELRPLVDMLNAWGDNRQGDGRFMVDAYNDYDDPDEVRAFEEHMNDINNPYKQGKAAD